MAKKGLRPYKEDLEKANAIVDRMRAEGASEEEIIAAVKRDIPNAAVISHLFGIAPKNQKRDAGDVELQRDIMGPPGREPGYVSELREFIRKAISKSTDLSTVANDLGLSILLAGLQKTGLSKDEFEAVFEGKKPMVDILRRAGIFCFEALDSYGTNAVLNLRNQRDEARARLVIFESRVEELGKKLDPAWRMEQMIYNLVITSAQVQVDPNVLDTLIDKWIALLTEINVGKTLMEAVST